MNDENIVTRKFRDLSEKMIRMTYIFMNNGYVPNSKVFRDNVTLCRDVVRSILRDNGNKVRRTFGQLSKKYILTNNSYVGTWNAKYQGTMRI